MDKTIKQLLIVSLVMIIVFVAWGVTREERWVVYTDSTRYVEHASFKSQESCNAGMKLFRIPAGCKRVDGIYRLLNDGPGSIFR